VPAATTISSLAERIANNDPAVAGRQGTILVDAAGRLAGIVTRGDLMSALQHDPAGNSTVLEAAKTDVAVAHPDETLQIAITRMLTRGIGRLPVVDRGDPTRVVGYLGRADILEARLNRVAEEEHRERGLKLKETA
jgi:CBS domain-containing protein